MARIFEDVISTTEIKKSKFICYLHRTSSEEDARDFIKYVRKKHPQATHACTAMVIGNIVRSNDDGEPSGTAGHPMLDVLTGNNLEDILAVVVRYFGGIKLGTGGLVRAYSGSVKDALSQAHLTEMTVFKEYAITFPYDMIGKMDQFFRSRNIEVVEKEYDESVTYYYLVTDDITELLKEISNGQIDPLYIEDIEKEQVIEKI